MARTAIKEPQLKSWEAVDQTMANIAELQRQINVEEANCNKQVDEIKDSSKQMIKPLQDQIKAFELQLKEFCEHRKAEFLKIKTKKLTFGAVGYRLSTTVSIPDPVFTCNALKELNLNSCLRTKIEPDKEAIKQLSATQLAEIGAKVNQKNVFGYEIHVVDPTATAKL